MRIDLNADVGESFGPWPLGEDETLIPLVTSANIACGAHAGDPETIERTVRLAVGGGTGIGAHPGYPDLLGFGRRDLDLTPDELEASVLYQVAAVAGIAAACGTGLGHVKTHGALYNRVAVDPAAASSVARAVRRLSDGLGRPLVVLGPPGSAMLAEAAAAGLPIAAEGFADRRYEPDGSLRSRRLAGAMLGDPGAAADQALSIVNDGRVQAVDGSWLEMPVTTLCVHGDVPGATATARAVRDALLAAGHELLPLGGS